MTVKVKSERKRGADPKRLKKGGAEVGLMSGSAAGEGSASLVEIGVWNEFGTERKTPDGKKVKHVPSRPFMRSSIEMKGREWKALVARVNKLVLEGKIDSEAASEILGQRMQADIQQRIVDLRDPPNAQSTIDAKDGKDNPLIDTGSMKDAIKYQVIT